MMNNQRRDAAPVAASGRGPSGNTGAKPQESHGSPHVPHDMASAPAASQYTMEHYLCTIDPLECLRSCPADARAGTWHSDLPVSDQSNNQTHQQAISSVLQSTPSMSNITAFMLSLSSVNSELGTCSVSVLIACMCHFDLQQERLGCPKDEQPCRCRHCFLQTGANACHTGRCPRALEQACPPIEGSPMLVQQLNCPHA